VTRSACRKFIQWDLIGMKWLEGLRPLMRDCLGTACSTALFLCAVVIAGVTQAILELRSGRVLAAPPDVRDFLRESRAKPITGSARGDAGKARVGLSGRCPASA
jgi:hypothetical protein